MSMIKVTSKVELDFKAILELERAQIQALERTAESVHTEVEQAQVMPFDTGNLQNESTFVDYSKSGVGKVSIVTTTPYARRLYFYPEYKFQTHENPNAKGKWYEDWMPGGANQDFAINAFMEHYRRLADL